MPVNAAILCTPLLQQKQKDLPNNGRSFVGAV